MFWWTSETSKTSCKPVMPSAECHTDHRLVRCILRLHLTPKPRKGGPLKEKFKASKFQSAEVRADFQAVLQSKLDYDDCPEDPFPETLWSRLKPAVLQTSEAVQGFVTKKNKDWFYENNQEIQELLVKKRSAHQTHLAQASSCEESCLPSHLQLPPTQALIDPE